jgi:aminoacrylate hydrolase
MQHAAGLWYEWHGPEEGEVLILSAGLGGSAHYWAPNLAALAERYRILLYDHRGTGRSEALSPGPTSVEAMARDVLDMMDGLGVPRASLLGHALGGLIGLALGATAPERLEKLVVVNGWANLDPYTARCFDLRLELLRRSGAEAYLKAQPIFLYPAGWISERLQALDAHSARQLADFPSTDSIEARVAAARAFSLAGDIPNEVLVLACADDMLVPARCSKVLAGALRRARLKTMEWGGHGCNVTDPAGFNRIVLEFLGS